MGIQTYIYASIFKIPIKQIYLMMHIRREIPYLICIVDHLAKKCAMRAKLRVFRSIPNVQDNESRPSVIGFRSDDSPHPLNHLSSTAARSDDNPNVSLRYIYSLIKNSWSSQYGHMA